MKKKFRFLRFGLKTFLVFVFACSASFAWIATANIERNKELAVVDKIHQTAVKSSADFFMRDSQLNAPSVPVTTQNKFQVIR